MEAAVVEAGAARGRDAPTDAHARRANEGAGTMPPPNDARGGGGANDATRAPDARERANARANARATPRACRRIEPGAPPDRRPPREARPRKW